MGLIRLPNPYGIDFLIDALTTGLYNRLKTVWSLTDDTKYNCFPRTYRTNTKDGYIPQFFDPTLKTYIDGSGKNSEGGMFYEDGLSAMSFIGLIDPDKNEGGKHTARLELLFFVDLDKITPGGITDTGGQRLDEVCVNDVRNYIQSNGSNFTVLDTYKDIDKVLERYSGSAKKEALKDNMHPKFCFKIQLELHYNPLLNKAFKIST